MSTIGKKLKTRAILRSPRVTEKSSVLAGNKSAVYVFEVSKEATKDEIRKVFQAKYKVKPEKINIVNLPNKVIRRRGRTGVKQGVKKAMVFLKSGDKIEIV
ncbi:MAG: 50S ribosomal protein L23 [Candidatus Paceibacterota bacterium]|jgi:large subunit ribosomal protein L23